MRRRRNIINFFELSVEWQAEAVSNLGLEGAEASLYLEPDPYDIPAQHVLWDLTEASWLKHGVAIVPISNNSALKLYVNSDVTEAVMKFI